MPIKRRSTKEFVIEHPMLKAGKRTAVLWLFIKQNPGATAHHLQGCHAYHPQVLADLVNEGLVTSKPSPYSSYKQYYAELENIQKPAKLKVSVVVEVFEGTRGQLLYRTRSPDMSVYSQEEGARFLREQRMYITLPLHAEEPGIEVVSKGVDPDDDLQDHPRKAQRADDVIDAEFVILPEKDSE